MLFLAKVMETRSWRNCELTRLEITGSYSAVGPTTESAEQGDITDQHRVPFAVRLA